MRVLVRIWQAYGNSLKTRPIATNIVTAGVVTVVGDILAQGIEHRNHVLEAEKDIKSANERSEIKKYEVNNMNTSVSASLSLSPSTSSAIDLSINTASPSFHLDLARSGRMLAWGTIVGGAPMYYWFRFLDRLWPPAKNTALSVAKKISFNQSTMGPLMNMLFFGYVISSANISTPELIPQKWLKKVERELIPTTLNAILFWAPAHVVNFYFVPAHYRVLYLSCGLVVWTAYLSFIGHTR